MLTLNEDSDLMEFRQQVERAIAAAEHGSDRQASPNGDLAQHARAMQESATLVALRRVLELVDEIRRELGDDPEATLEVLLRLTRESSKRVEALASVLSRLAEIEDAVHLPHLRVPLYLRAAQLSAEEAAFRVLRDGPPDNEDE